MQPTRAQFLEYIQVSFSIIVSEAILCRPSERTSQRWKVCMPLDWGYNTLIF